MNNLTLSKILAATLAFGVILPFWGCQSQGNRPNPVVGRSNSMILHLQDDPAGLNPVNTVGAQTASLHNLIFDHLITLDPKSLELVPQLAASMPEISEDKLSYTFQLRPGLTFADGKPLTSEDVVFSFKALMNPFVSSAPRRAELHNFEDCISQGPETVIFKLIASGPFNLNRLAINFFVIPKHIYDPLNMSDAYSALDAKKASELGDAFTDSTRMAMLDFADFFEDEKYQRKKGFVIGSGRYIFDAWKSKQFLRFVKNENYWNNKSDAPFAMQGMDTLIYKVIPDQQTALMALKSGEIDFSDSFDPDQYHDQMSGEGYDTHFGKTNVPYPFYEYAGWNANIKGHPKKTFFADPNVRMALSKLIDVDDIVENLLFGTAAPIASMVYKSRKEYAKELSPIKFDEKGAIALLDAAGWIDQDGNGVREKMVQGEKVNFSFKLAYKTGNEIRKRIGRHIQDHFSKVGIEVELTEMEGGVLLSRLTKHEIEAWLGGWVYDSDEQDLFALFHSSQIRNGGYNWGSYANLEADSTMEQITVEWDEVTRMALHKKIQTILYNEQPYTLLFANSARIGWNKRLKNIGWYDQRPCYDPGQFSLAK